MLRRANLASLPSATSFLSQSKTSFVGRPGRQEHKTEQNASKLPRYLRRQSAQTSYQIEHPRRSIRDHTAGTVRVLTREEHPNVSKNGLESKRLLEPHVLSGRLKKLCDAGKVDAAVLMLKNSPLDAQNTPVWNTLMWECMKAKRFKLSYELFVDMKRRGFSPSTRTFQTMFMGLSRIEDWASHTKQLANARSLYNYFRRHTVSMKKEDPQSAELSISPVASYLKILGDAGEYQEMFDVYNEMDQTGPMSPNQFIFTAMFRALSERRARTADGIDAMRIQNASDAKLLWAQMLKASNRSPGFPIDTHLASAAIRVLSRGRPVDQALAYDIVRDYCGLTKPGEKSLSNIPITVHTLAAALSLCNSTGQHSLCIHFWRQVVERPEKATGVEILDQGHMEEVLRAHVAISTPFSPVPSQNALRTLEWMLRQEAIGPNGPRIRPAISTYNLTLLACWRCSDWPSAIKVFELMTGYKASHFGDENENWRNPFMEKRTRGRNLMPDVETMSYLVHAALKAHSKANIRQALRMVNHIGLDHLFGASHSPHHQTSSDQKHSRIVTVNHARLARALCQSVEQISSDRHSPKSRSASQCDSDWIHLRTRSEEILRAARSKSSAASGANTMVTSRTSLSENKHYSGDLEPPQTDYAMRVPK